MGSKIFPQSLHSQIFSEMGPTSFSTPKGHRQFTQHPVATSHRSSPSPAARLDLDDNAFASLTICMIGVDDFIVSHLYEKLMPETNHVILVVDVSPPYLTTCISFNRCSGRHEHDAARSPPLPRPFGRPDPSALITTRTTGPSATASRSMTLVAARSSLPHHCRGRRRHGGGGLPWKNSTTCSKLSSYVCHCYVCAPRLPTLPSPVNLLLDVGPLVDSPPEFGEISMPGRCWPEELSQG
jgi:hypothetical protein